MTNLLLPPQNKKSATYLLFRRTPAVLSLILALVLWVAGIEFGFVMLPNSWEANLFIILLAIPYFILCDAIAFQANRIMMRKRLWGWGKIRFSNWDEMKNFIDNTPNWKLEQIIKNDYVDWDKR
jgi:hypothetical protein